MARFKTVDHDRPGAEHSTPIGPASTVPLSPCFRPCYSSTCFVIAGCVCVGVQACVQRVIKAVLPENVQIGKDAKAAFSRSAGIFIM